MKSEVIRVLLIEDNRDNAMLLLEEMKEARGNKIELVCEERLSTGLKRVRNEGFDVILLDLSLPDSQGIDTFIKVRTQVPQIPIIILSGNDDESLAVKTIQAGAQDYLVKGELDVNVLARSMHYAIERQKMMDELISMVFTDKLTGLHNRRGLDILAEQQLNIADRTKSGLFVIYVDLNGLKRINDTMGHHEGDQALLDTANIFKETFRASDIIARIGGDEFVIVSIGDRKDSENIESRLKENIRIRNSRGIRSYKISMSVGIAYYDPENPVSLDELLVRADELMYEQKLESVKH